MAQIIARMMARMTTQTTAQTMSQIMALIESLFDATYLCLVVALGARLLLEKTRGAKMFGIMAILLGAGDAFHLVPRIVSHLSPGGFTAHAAALSWGQFVTSITMTVFYVLFYQYYRQQSGDRDPKKASAIYLLALLRIALVLMPQNGWGAAEGSYLFGIYRNIPFAALGALLIYWTYLHRQKPGLRYMSLMIFLSFAFYIPVVLWSGTFPIVGALMMPKTVAYLMIVIFGYRFYINKFSSRSILGIAFANLIMGLLGGVFYREFTKFYGFEGVTHLGKLHVHTLTLGFIALLVIYACQDKEHSPDSVRRLKKPLYTYMAGLTLSVVSMAVTGIYEIVGEGAKTVSMPALEGISGLGHITLATGLVWLVVSLFRAVDQKTRTQA